MNEITAAAIICLSDWGVAASHMAYKDHEWYENGTLLLWPPKRLDFYERKLPIFGDAWHLVAGFRYIAFTALAWEVFVHWWMYPATAIVCGLGWLALKWKHGKLAEWDWKPRWLKQLTGGE